MNKVGVLGESGVSGLEGVSCITEGKADLKVADKKKN